MASPPIQQEMSYFDLLGDDLLIHVLQSVSRACAKSIARMNCVCKRTRRMIEQEHIVSTLNVCLEQSSSLEDLVAVCDLLDKCGPGLKTLKIDQIYTSLDLTPLHEALRRIPQHVDIQFDGGLNIFQRDENTVGVVSETWEVLRGMKNPISIFLDCTQPLNPQNHLQILATLPNLYGLYACNWWADSDIEGLANSCTALQSLTLRNTEGGNAHVDSLSRLSGLTALKLCDFPDVSTLNWIATMTRLESLSMKWMWNVASLSPLQGLPLKELSLVDSLSISPQEMGIIHSIGTLEVLKLKGNVDDQDHACGVYGDFDLSVLKNLRRLVFFNVILTDSAIGLNALTSLSSQLTALTIRSCRMMTETYDDIPRNGFYEAFDECEHLDLDQVSALRAAFPNAEIHDV